MFMRSQVVARFVLACVATGLLPAASAPAHVAPSRDAETIAGPLGPGVFGDAAFRFTSQPRTATTAAAAEDVTPPDTTITSGPSGTTSDTTPTFEFTSTEANSTFECRIDGGSFARCSSPFTTGPLSDGAHAFEVRAIDTAGNVDPSPATRSFTVQSPPPDNDPPDTTITDGPSGTTNDTTPTFEFTSTEADSTFECRIDEGSYTPCTSPLTTETLDPGSHLFEVRAIDEAGNVDPTPAGREFVVAPPTPPDTTRPDTTITAGPSDTTDDTTPTFEFTSDEANSIFECRIDGGPFASCATPFTAASLSLGAHTFEVRAIDPSANIDPTPAGRSFTVASPAPPDTTITSGPSGTTTVTTPTFQFTSNEAGSTFECRIDGGPFTGCSAPLTTAFLAPGAHTFEVRAIDPAGNIDPTPARRVFTVQLPLPPPPATASCEGSPATIIGTHGIDVLKGTPGRDVIVGLGGDDRIDGRGGDDIICAGDGTDRLDGGAGDDVLAGGGENDELNGGSGTDLLVGDEGDDRLKGGSGGDDLDGGSGEDVILGGSGRDRIHGDPGSDSLQGGRGNDTLSGGPGDDRINGGSGEDSCRGGSGRDRTTNC